MITRTLFSIYFSISFSIILNKFSTLSKRDDINTRSYSTNGNIMCFFQVNSEDCRAVSVCLFPEIVSSFLKIVSYIRYYLFQSDHKYSSFLTITSGFPHDSRCGSTKRASGLQGRRSSTCGVCRFCARQSTTRSADFPRIGTCTWARKLSSRTFSQCFLVSITFMNELMND